jgi:pimeloyl-ACP methyl ester carboxylesterase
MPATGEIPKPLFRSVEGKERYREAYTKALTLWTVPFEELDVATRFGTTHVLVAGRANDRPIVLLHSAQASSTMWFPNIEALSRNNRVVAVDFLLEVGKSKLEKAIRTRAELASWLTELLDNLQLEEVDIVGISRGAWNALALALVIPQRIRNLVLLSPAQTFTPVRNLRFLLGTIRCSFFPSERAIRALSRIAFHDPERVPDLFLKQYALGLQHFNLANGIYLPPSLFSDEDLRRLKTRTLLMIGDHDVVNTRESIEKAMRLIPGIETEIVPAAGHILTMDRAEYVNGRIIEFLARR